VNGACRWLPCIAVISGVALGVAGEARAGCGSDRNCKAPRICVAKVCVAPECTKVKKCKAGFECAAGRCAKLGACANDMDCPGQETCEQGRCVIDTMSEVGGPSYAEAARFSAMIDDSGSKSLVPWGVGVLGTVWLTTIVTTATLNGSGDQVAASAVPLLGPLLFGESNGRDGLLALSFVGQAVGLTMLIVGLVDGPSQTWVSEGPRGLAPVVGLGVPGAAFGMTLTWTD